MKKLFLTNVLILITTTFIFGQINLPDSIYIYNEAKQKDYFYIQKDVFCFNFSDNSVLDIELPSYVDTVFSYDNSYSTFNAVCFSNSCSEIERFNFVNYIMGLENFNSVAMGISPQQEIHAKQMYYPTDDLILVTFKDPKLSISEIEKFGQRYNLTLVYSPRPKLPSSVSWTYVFQNKTPRTIEHTTIYLSNIINEAETELVELAEPNTFSAFPLSCEAPIDEMNESPDNNNYTWYINNEGGNIFNGDIGIADADADICECWNEGLTGEGIKVGIIDFGGFEINHPDFLGANIPFIRDIKNNDSTTTNVYYEDDSTSWSHAMLVGGLIMAQPNNISNNTGHAIGVSYNSTFIPYLCGENIGFPGGANNLILDAIHKAIFDEIDVLNMSLGLSIPGTLSGQLYNAVITGRPNPNNPNKKRGMVVVAAIGNDDMQHGTGQGSSAIFPANKSYTLGVGYSTPEDYRASTSSSTEGTYSWGMPANSGSDYGNITLHFDVVAPGVVIRSTNFINGEGNGYLVRTGSSLSSPIVASIVALVLEEKPDLKYDEVISIIRKGAEKVHSTLDGGIYQYGTDGNGYNNKMFYGRVSCINSFNIATTLGIEEEEYISTFVKHIDEGLYVVETEIETSKNIILYSMDGRLLLNKTIQGKSIEINLKSFPKGIYLLKINNQEFRFETKLVH